MRALVVRGVGGGRRRAWGLAMTLAAALAPAGQVGADEAGRVLTESDAALYRQIFAAQEDGDWRRADDWIARVADPVLMGHVRFQRLMHPTAWRSTYGELRDWLAAYGDHPDADRVHRLALRRKPAAAPAPALPRAPDVNGRWPIPPAAGSVAARRVPAYERPRSPEAAARVRSALAHVDGHLRRGEIRGAMRDLAQGTVITSLLDDTERAILKARIAAAAFYEGQDETALALAADAAARARRFAPEADWIAGLAAWSLGRTDVARTHFEVAAASSTLNARKHAGAAFWAARANLATGRPEQVVPWLRIAAGHPDTLYGLLALRQLGREPPFDFGTPALEPAETRRILGIAAVRRAIALSQIGRYDDADREIRAVRRHSGPGIALPLLAVVGGVGLAATELRLGQRLAGPHGYEAAGARYPVPSWIPDDPDRALLLALARQESEFDVRARNGAAWGLMQLLPSTAGLMSGEPDRIRQNPELLYDPGLNVELGRRYVRALLDDLGDNLVLVVAAYNAGPYGVLRWTPLDDPLLFIEKVPVRETRTHVERVLANLWIYRLRLEQESPELDSLAAYAWPVYTAESDAR